MTGLYKAADITTLFLFCPVTPRLSDVQVVLGISALDPNLLIHALAKFRC